MSSSFRLLTEEESAQIAEVSVDTIRKYRDCGLLDPIVKENRTFFQELDIRTLFYANIKEKPADTAPDADTQRMQAVEAEPVEEAPPVVEAEEPKSPPVVELVGQRSELPAAGELLELNKSLREQIQVLREERDWLRERIEKLEARSEREQMLLLSETENVRKLINTSRKGFWQRALPWLGQ